MCAALQGSAVICGEIDCRSRGAKISADMSTNLLTCNAARHIEFKQAVFTTEQYLIYIYILLLLFLQYKKQVHSEIDGQNYYLREK